VVRDAAYKEFMSAEDQAILAELVPSMYAALWVVWAKSYTMQHAVGLYPSGRGIT